MERERRHRYPIFEDMQKISLHLREDNLLWVTPHGRMVEWGKWTGTTTTEECCVALEERKWEYAPPERFEMLDDLVMMEDNLRALMELSDLRAIIARCRDCPS